VHEPGQKCLGDGRIEPVGRIDLGDVLGGLGKAEHRQIRGEAEGRLDIDRLIGSQR